MARSLLERLDGGGDELDAHALALAGIDVGTSTVTHEKAVDVMTGLLTLGQRMATAETPPQLRALMRMMHQCRPLIREYMARVPVEQIVGFMKYLRGEIDAVIESAPAEDAATPAAVLVDGQLFIDVPIPFPAEVVADEQPDDGEPGGSARADLAAPH